MIYKYCVLIIGRSFVSNTAVQTKHPDVGPDSIHTNSIDAPHAVSQTLQTTNLLTKCSEYQHSTS